MDENKIKRQDSLPGATTLLRVGAYDFPENPTWYQEGALYSSMNNMCTKWGTHFTDY